MNKIVFALVAVLVPSTLAIADSPVRIGSKSDTETTLLATIIAQTLSLDNVRAEMKTRLGGSPVVWEALLAGSIDVYVEYTGTLTKQLLADKGIRDDAELRTQLTSLQVGMTQPLGFSNNYAIGMKRSRAEQLRIQSIADLRNHPELSLGFSSEFLKRDDGWPGLRNLYRLPQKKVVGMDHRIAYEALTAGEIDATELYTTDAEIRRFDLITLVDDQHYFPIYQAVIIYRADLERRSPKSLLALKTLVGKFSEAAIIDMNGRVQSGEPLPLIAADFVEQQFGKRPDYEIESDAHRLGRLTWEHLKLVGISLGAAILIGLPLGIISARRPRTGHVLIGGAGVIQTIPALALLVFMIPLLKTGALPAIVALFLYSLLPIINNTAVGLRSIPTSLRESAEGLGLTPYAQLRLIELPLASRAILTGIKTSAIINIGTATLGAFIGAGGYGQPIQTGLQLVDHREILFGAIPAALMALIAQGLFALAERVLVPKGLQLAQTA